MFDEIDAAYFLTRAQEERAKAADFDSDTAAEKHLRLADIYEEKARQLKGFVDTD